ncbi:MAG: hypothetical protein V1709_00845 [Planctomycetota bacterium]
MIRRFLDWLLMRNNPNTFGYNLDNKLEQNDFHGLREGPVKKGGVNRRPQTPRPEGNPKPQRPLLRYIKEGKVPATLSPSGGKRIKESAD